MRARLPVPHSLLGQRLPLCTHIRPHTPQAKAKQRSDDKTLRRCVGVRTRARKCGHDCVRTAWSLFGIALTKRNTTLHAISRCQGEVPISLKRVAAAEEAYIHKLKALRAGQESHRSQLRAQIRIFCPPEAYSYPAHVLEGIYFMLPLRTQICTYLFYLCAKQTHGTTI